MRGGADGSVTVRMDKRVKAAIATIGDDAWTPIEYTDAVFDETTSPIHDKAVAATTPDILSLTDTEVVGLVRNQPSDAAAKTAPQEA